MYKIEVTALYGHLKAVGRQFIDVAGTMLAFLLRLDEVLSIRRGHGLSEKVCSGQRVWTIIVSQSDRPETLPYPTERIRIFQKMIRSASRPRVFRYRPTTVSWQSLITCVGG